jgi:hypothetical protein
LAILWSSGREKAVLICNSGCKDWYLRLVQYYLHSN